MPSTTFYSTKRNANVMIPNNKVCGYRISNNIMKKGYSDGVRAGRDNGVVNQSLSRFSTERQREEAGSNCAGNVNWLNHRTGENFNPPESAKNQFNIDRNAFYAGTEYKQTNQAQSIDKINRRAGQGNREIVRPSFLAADIHARLPIDFDKLQAMDIAEFGAKVRLGENQLEKLTMVAVPDPQDTQWLEERRRRIAVLRQGGMTNAQIEQELQVNKPLGREQRTINKPSKNIAREGNLTVQAKLAEIKQEIDNGNAQSRVQQAQLSGQMAVLLQNQNAVSRLTDVELRSINTSLMRLRVPKDYRAVFPGNRIIAGNDQYFTDNKGVIAMFLMSNIPTDRSPNQPVLSWSNRDNRYNPVALLQIYQMGATRFLDMENRVIDDAGSLAAKGLVPPIAGVVAPVAPGMPGAPDFDLFA
jgi:hypothetical protein